MDEDKELLSIALLIDELRHENIINRLNSVSKLLTISQALGPNRTRDELLPYLIEFVDDEDEVLIAISLQLPNLMSSIGGNNYLYHLLRPLEGFAALEESNVRESAVKSIQVISEQMNDIDISDHLFPLLQRLATGDWFTSRVSACQLFSIVYTRVPQQIQEECVTLFCYLCRDETPMVRRASCSQIGLFASKIDVNYVKSDLVPAFSNLAKDEQDSVRLLTVENVSEIAKSLSLDDMTQLLTPTIFYLTTDASWRVRYACAVHFVKLCLAAGEQVTKDEMTHEFVHLLQDPEPEVRTAAASKVTDVCHLLGPDLTVKFIIPCMKELVTDSCEFTRASMASVVMGLASILYKQDVFDHLLPIFLQLLKDVNPEVRLNIISKLEALNAVIGVDTLSPSLLPAVVDLAADSKWRIRLAIIQQVPLLAQQLGEGFFETKLSDLCMAWLGDKVYSIREAATLNLIKLTEIFGVQWSQQIIVPKVYCISGSPNYLYRLTSVYAMKDMAPLYGNDGIAQSLLPIASKLASDSVPNLRFNVAKLLNVFLSIVTPEFARLEIRPILISLSSDPDNDVSFFGQQALDLCDSLKHN